MNERRAMIVFEAKVLTEFEAEGFEAIMTILKRQSHYDPRVSNRRGRDDEFFTVYSFAFDTRLDQFLGWGYFVEDWVEYVLTNMYNQGIPCLVKDYEEFVTSDGTEFEDVPY